MRVLYYDIRPADPEFVREHALEACPFERLVRASDVLTLHVPLTSRTRHMLNRESLGWMQPTAVLINAARGGIVDDTALYAALTERRLRGAGLDVFEEEPPRRDSPCSRSTTSRCRRTPGRATNRGFGWCGTWRRTSGGPPVVSRRSTAK